MSKRVKRGTRELRLGIATRILSGITDTHAASYENNRRNHCAKALAFADDLIAMADEHPPGSFEDEL